MLINKVAKQCNLTKKAIQYYVDQKLIFPDTLENGYKNFSQENIETLKLISLYRKLGLSITEIKNILSKNIEIKTILYKRTLDLEEEKIKQDLLKRICDGEDVKKLEQEINNINSKSIIIKKLMDLFPSYYGKFISLNFSRYLTCKIETEEQMIAFREIIDFFDNVPDFDIPKDLQEYLDKYLEEYSSNTGIEKINHILNERDKSIKNIDEFVKNNKEVLNIYNDYKQTKEYKNTPAYRLMQLMKEFCSTNGYYDKFIPAMRKLSPLYNEYYEQLLKANEEFIKKYPEYMNN